MIKKMLYMALLSLSCCGWAATPLHLHHAPLNSIKTFSISSSKNTIAAIASGLKLISQTQQEHMSIARYQQVYQGIPVIGAQITVSKETHQLLSLTDAEVNGHLFDDIQIETHPTMSPKDALLKAKKAYLDAQDIHDEHSELQIRATAGGQLKLVYWVSFKSVSSANLPLWPVFIIDANNGDILKQWNNLHTYLDTGPGGNEKTQEYWYGKDGLPSLEVTQSGNTCILDDNTTRVTNVESKWDWNHLIQAPMSYTCDHNDEDVNNGAYSIGNDAYYFGHVITSLFNDWYGVPVLQDKQGRAAKLFIRVHFGASFENAFWDGESLNFGDGASFFYPLASLDVAAHEAAHGFTEQHSGLEYHDQSGALNESFSDMAGQAARAYLLENNPELYRRAYMHATTITWGIGESIIKMSGIEALRFMNIPSKDHVSADCLDKKLARSQRSICAIQYAEVVATAKSHYPNDENGAQSYIVHTGSGVFNRAFYLMSNQWDIKTAFRVMVLANTKYWTPTTDFTEAACGALFAAEELKLDTLVIHASFRKVGIDTSTCKI